MATGTNGIATVADVLSISGVEVSGSYTSSQCVKYSDISKVTTIPLTTIDMLLDLGEFTGWMDGDGINLTIYFYQKGSNKGNLTFATLRADEVDYVCEVTRTVQLPVSVDYPYYMKLTWDSGELAGGQHDYLHIIINGSTTTLDQFTSGSSREFDLSSYRSLYTIDSNAVTEVLSNLSVTINA